MKFKFTHKLADGTEQEIEAPEGWLPPEEIKKGYKAKSEVEGMVNRLVESGVAEAVAKQKTALLEDADFVSQIFQKHNVPLDEDGKVKFPEGGIKPEDLSQRLAENLKFHEAQWKEKTLDPLTKEREALSKELQQMREHVLLSELAEGARGANVADAKFEAFPGMGAHSAPVYNARSLFAWDKKTGSHALVERKDPDGTVHFKINPNGAPERPYYGPQDYYKDIASNEKAFKSGGWFKDERPNETLLGNPNGGGGTFDPSTASDAELAKQLGI